jgi:hypothetical protein
MLSCCSDVAAALKVRFGLDLIRIAIKSGVVKLVHIGTNVRVPRPRHKH